MSGHPYWSYGPDGGQPVVEALDEGRRAFALEQAVLLGETLEGTLEAAEKFEQYLKGERK